MAVNTNSCGLEQVFGAFLCHIMLQCKKKEQLSMYGKNSCDIKVAVYSRGALVSNWPGSDF